MGLRLLGFLTEKIVDWSSGSFWVVLNGLMRCVESELKFKEVPRFRTFVDLV